MSLKTQLETIKKSHNFIASSAAMREVDLRNLPPHYFTQLGRHLAEFDNSNATKIAFLGNFSLDLLPDYVNVTTGKYGLQCTGYVGPYNQYFQEVLDSSSGLHSFAPDMIFLFLTMRALEPEVAHSFTALNSARRRELLNKITSHIQEWVVATADRFKVPLVVSNFPLPAYTQSGLADQSDELGEMRFYYDLNTQLSEMFFDRADVQIFDLAKLTNRFGTDNIFDPKFYYMAKMLWSERFLTVVAEEILRTIIALNGSGCKCLVVDLDNTLWGGVLGEEGVRGVKVGVGDPVSESFFDFQLKIKALKEMGVILAICSKNNETDVQEIFELRNEMPLHWEDFAAWRINWERKDSNIRDIATELNIGLESIVFIDDSPVECDLVRTMLPEVQTFQVPPQPENMVALIDRLPVFERRTILADDRHKTDQYRQNRQRNQLMERVSDLGEYLHSLNTEISIREPHRDDLDRVHQLFTKTNQFNVTTIRYPKIEIEDILNNSQCDLYIISARDKFGDLGIIGLYLTRIKEAVAEVDSFILSCRAMGRGIESAIMNHLKSRTFDQANAKHLEAKFIPTKKNKPVERFFDEQGFEMVLQGDGGTRHYRLDAENSREVECPWINFKLEDK
jgi:FkbH-like protein